MFGRPSLDQQRSRRQAEREAHMSAAVNSTLARRTATLAVFDVAAKPIEKDPHTVNPHLRNLARGEACTGLRYGSYCHCDPATTVLAHSNLLADGKGMGRKSRDECSAFLGFDCHSFLDQGKASAEEKAEFMAAAQQRTRQRWAQIAADTTEKPWKRQAAQWALDQLKERA